MLKVLLTGFEPFNNARLNPSEQLVLRLKPDSVPGAQMLTAVLPVVYGEAGAAEAFSDSIVTKLGWKSHAPKDGEQAVL